MRTNDEIFEDLVLAEASAWLVRLQGTGRNEASEAAFRAWLAEDVVHARAFARVTETWDIVPGAARMNATASTARPRPRLLTRRRWLATMAASVVLAALGAGIASYERRDPEYRTLAGEQRTIILDDGTRVTLNTDTLLAVDYERSERRIRLSHGEAIFNVAKNPQRPFIVQAGDRTVRALGTVFDVRSDPERLEVTLVRGRVEVARVKSAEGGMKTGDTASLSPGDRMTVRPGREPTMDRPNMDEITAWQRGEAMFDDATLAEVVAELNRYGTGEIRIDDPSLARLRVSGVFTTRDPAEAASAIAKLHDLRTVRSGNGTVITR